MLQSLNLLLIHVLYLSKKFSSYTECESNPTSRNKIIILGGGPNRIGQGIGLIIVVAKPVLLLKG